MNNLIKDKKVEDKKETKKKESPKKKKEVFHTLRVKTLSDGKPDLEHLDLDKDKKEAYLLVDLNQLTSADLYSTLVKHLQSASVNYIVDLDNFVDTLSTSLSKQSVVCSLVSAIEMGNVKVGRSFKTKEDKNKKTHSFAPDHKHAKLVDEYISLASAQTFTRTLQDTPSNILNPDELVKQVQDYVKDLDTVKVTVLNREQLQEKGMNLVYSVGKGSAYGPYVVTLEYCTDPKLPKVALVGKGVCFDTGGYNIKTQGYMSKMKFDMTGSVSVAAVVGCLARNKVKANVVGILGVVENVISPTSYRPDDVVISYQGTSVEVDNTDAEGRLVLADCLAYAYKDFKPDLLVSVATLTGAIIVALGDKYFGVWASDDKQWDRVSSAAENAGEGVWRMPFHKDYLEPLKSEIADWKNSASSSQAPSCRAAVFLKEFTNNLPYIHLDIAGVDCTTKGVGTGTVVRTLYHLVKN